MPSPLTDNPLEIPCNSVFVFGLVKLIKSFLSGDIEIEAPVSHIRENFDDFFMFLNDRNDAVDRTCCTRNEPRRKVLITGIAKWEQYLDGFKS